MIVYILFLKYGLLNDIWVNVVDFLEEKVFEDISQGSN